MEQIELHAMQRTEMGKKACKQYRKQELIPAVAYSHGKDALALTCSKREFEHIIHSHGTGNMVIHLMVGDNGAKNAKTVIVKEVQFHPIRGDVIHVDFQEISLTDTITVKIPIKIKGEAIGVKQDSGILDHHLWEIEVECLPTDIPEEIIVPVSDLEIGAAMHIQDIAFPQGVTPLHEGETVILSVIAPSTAEISEEPAEDEAMQEPEIIKQKKDDEGADEGKKEE